MDILKTLSEWQTWDGSDWSNLFAIAGGVVLVGGILWSTFLYPRKRLKTLETETQANVITTIKKEAAETLKPLVEDRVAMEFTDRYRNITSMQAELARIHHDMGTARATIHGVQENREHLAQLSRRLDEIAIKAEEGYRYARYMHAGTALTKRRVNAKGEEWRQLADVVRAKPAGDAKTVEERALFNALVDICEPVISNAVVYESLELTPVPTGTPVHAAYDQVIDEYARRATLEALSSSKREQAFHERLTESCIRNLQDSMYTSYRPAASHSPQSFYAHVVRICTLSVTADILALKKGEDLP
jgi:hypothetical protein